MNSALVLSILIAALSSLGIVIVSIRRLLSIFSIGTFCTAFLSLFYFAMWIACGLRVLGLLPDSSGIMNMRVLTETATGIKDSNSLSIIFYSCAFGIVVINSIITWVIKQSVFHSSWRWLWIIIISFIVLLLLLSAEISIIGGLSIYDVFFDVCCGVMALGAYAFGLTYKEFCVIGNIYLQALILIISALSITISLLNKLKNKKSIIRIVFLLLSICYSFLFIVGFILICQHYYMPLEDAFDLCVKELNSFGKSFYNVGYIGANFVIFVLGWLSILIFNLVINKIVKKSLK